MLYALLNIDKSIKSLFTNKQLDSIEITEDDPRVDAFINRHAETNRVSGVLRAAASGRDALHHSITGGPVNEALLRHIADLSNWVGGAEPRLRYLADAHKLDIAAMQSHAQQATNATVDIAVAFARLKSSKLDAAAVESYWMSLAAIASLCGVNAPINPQK